VLTAKGRAMVKYFEDVATAIGDSKAAANRISDLIYPALTERNEEIDEFSVNAANYADFIKRTAALNKQDRVDLFKYMLENETTLDTAMEKTGIKPATFDETTLRAAVVEAIGKNPRAVTDFKAGKDAAKMAIVGAVMKANKGVPNDVVRKLVDEELAKG